MKNLYEDIANKAAEIIGFSQTDIETFDRSKSSLLLTPLVVVVNHLVII